MPDADVTQQGAQPSGAGDKPQGGKGADEKVTLTRSEFEALNRQLRETQESERFWANKSRGGQQAEHTDEAEETIETDDLVPEVTGDSAIDQAIFNDPDKWAEAISKGPAAIKAFVKSMGLVTGAEAADIAAKVARRTVDVERQKMGSDAVIMRDFPDLNDPKSEHFKATSAELKKLVALDPRAKNSPATLYAAAETAKAKLEVKKANERRRSNRDDDDSADDRYDRAGDRGGEPEDERRRRADSQDGTRRQSRDTEDDLDLLGPEARQVIKEMGITADEFAASAKEVRGSRPRGRR